LGLHYHGVFLVNPLEAIKGKQFFNLLNQHQQRDRRTGIWRDNGTRGK